jgi:hypothetical protein
MKKSILLLAAIFSFVLSMNSQDIADSALGIRIGDIDGFGGEISYQKKIGYSNRLEFDFGFRQLQDDVDFAYKLTTIFQWVMFVEGGFNWYLGAGLGFGSGEYRKSIYQDGLFMNVDANIGFEYDFYAPILISIDFRPEIGVIGNYGKDTDLDLAVSIRYQF